MQKEMESLLKNKEWDLVELPPDQKAVGNKWVFKRNIKRKINADGSLQKYKVRLVAK